MSKKVTTKRHILISVAGLTPQVITETLYYLTQLRSPPTIISEIYILTTSPGKEKLVSSLLEPRHGKYFALLRDYDIPMSTIQFDTSHILILKDAQGNGLQDIRTRSDNEAVADQILSFVREKAADSSCCLHCSLAGGRKTMGLYLGLALQLYGRPGDALSHVLVHPPELETDSAFFYPPPEHRPFRLQNGRILKAAEIRVELAEIPILLLKDKIPLLQERTELGYSELVNLTQEEFELLHFPSPLIINRTSRSLHIGEISIPLTPLQFAVYLFLARRRLEGCHAPDCQGCEGCFCPADEFLDATTIAQLKAILQEVGARDTRCDTLPGWNGQDAIERFYQVRSKINSRINTATRGMSWAGLYKITKLPSAPRGESRYGISLDRRLIKIN
ncbi:MAG: CRISPR-associated ring nuclease Csm6 [Candidatus Poribacteria bacterium]